MFVRLRCVAALLTAKACADEGLNVAAEAGPVEAGFDAIMCFVDSEVTNCGCSMASGPYSLQLSTLQPN